MSDQYPSRELDKVVIRLPDGLKDRIRRVAEENGRSVNSELVKLLDKTYPEEETLDGCVQTIADIIEKQSPDRREDSWRAVFRKLESLKDAASKSR